MGHAIPSKTNCACVSTIPGIYVVVYTHRGLWNQFALTKIQTVGTFFAPDGIRLEKLNGGEIFNDRTATTFSAAARVLSPCTVILPSFCLGLLGMGAMVCLTLCFEAPPVRA